MDMQDFLNRIRHATGAHWAFLLALVIVSSLGYWAAGVIQIVLIAAAMLMDVGNYADAVARGDA